MTRFGRYLVGPEALSRYRNGTRLVWSVKEQENYDLKPELSI